MTTKFANPFVVVLFVFALLSMALSACNPTEAFTVQASGEGAANAGTVRISERIEGCDFSSKQLLLNAANAETNQDTGAIDGVTLDQWLDSQMSTFSCIAAAE